MAKKSFKPKFQETCFNCCHLDDNDVHEDDRHRTAMNSYRVATFVGKELPTRPDRDWAYDARHTKGCKYKSNFQAEAEALAKKNREALDAFMAKK